LEPFVAWLARSDGGDDMKNETTVAASAGLVVGFAFGITFGAAIMMTRSDETTTSAAAEAPAVAEPAAAAATGQAMGARASARPAAEAPTAHLAVVAVDEPELRERVRSVLAQGTQIDRAIEGFNSAEEFLAVAYAARNTQVPFILLKHRVLEQDMSLADAIRASGVDVDADAEAARARHAARTDLAALRPSLGG
jgi:hypothetical protein